MDFARLTQGVDLYCERLAPGIWAEPINALSNFSFFLAAWCLHKLYQQHFSTSISGPDGRNQVLQLADVRRLIHLVAVVGVGSLLFHTLATSWAMVADVLPIVLFLLLFLAVFLTRVARLRYGGLALGFAAFFGASAAFAILVPSEIANGSQNYFSCLLALLCMAIYVRWRGYAEAHDYAWAAVIFGASLAARIFDLRVCAYWSIGTHFIWHVLNALCLYLICKAIILRVAMQTRR